VPPILKLLLPALLSLGPVSAQRFSVEVSQKLPEHDTIVVADVSDVSRAPAVGGIEVRATLSVRRAIQGTLAAGAAIPVTWHETPTAFGNSGFNVLPSGRSLWLLQKAADGGRYDPVQLGPFGVFDVPQYYYLPLPAEDLPADFSRMPGDTVDARLARELGFALEALARSGGAGLNVRRVWAPSGALSVYGSGDTFLFGRTVALLWQFRPAEGRPLFERFEASTLPNLRTVGLAGLLRLGEVSVIAKLERDAEALAPTTEAERIPRAIDELADLPWDAVLSLSRTAVARPEMPGLESCALYRLGESGRAEALPYVAAMLESLNRYTRGEAAMAFCRMFRPRSSGGRPLAKFWDPAMADYCPNVFPGNRDAEVAEFWRDWWREHRKTVPELADLPPVDAPARDR
jgi:hypothetical protein